ncbi:hypothetical protein [Aeromicrobium alkaliterrae]|uniref:hypothetical protein n=1 Tax=Aeromicrobium alkaliterrae TaxID=302168 RepID=UPI0031D09F4C
MIGLVAWLLPRTDEDPPPEARPTAISNPDQTMHLGSQGLTIDLVDPVSSAVTSWPAPDSAGAPVEYALTSDGLTVPSWSPDAGGRWLLIQDPSDPEGTSSLANIHREVDGALSDIQFRVWPDRTEFVWTSEFERTWTVAWDGREALPVAGNSFTHAERAETTRTYEFEGVLADDGAPEGTPLSVTFGRGIPGTTEIAIPDGGSEAPRAAPVIGGRADVVQLSSCLQPTCFWRHRRHVVSPTGRSPA